MEYPMEIPGKLYDVIKAEAIKVGGVGQGQMHAPDDEKAPWCVYGLLNKSEGKNVNIYPPFKGRVLTNQLIALGFTYAEADNVIHRLLRERGVTIKNVRTTRLPTDEAMEALFIRGK